MDPVFTLQWPEFLLAQQLQKVFPKAQGYSLLVPLSRQEKAIDLAILKKGCGSHTTVTVQIKASRTYLHPPPKKEGTKRFRFETWFKCFVVPEEADFFILFGLYAPDAGRTERVSSNWYRDCSLLFTHAEMRALIESCLTVGGKPDRMFGFGFDESSAVFLTRGDQTRSLKDYSSYVLDRRIDLIRNALKNGRRFG
jgi:hypothetical protein